MKNNLKIDEITIISTDNCEDLYGSERFKNSNQEIIQQGPDWTVIAYSRTRTFSKKSLERIKRLTSLLLWIKRGKTGTLREIRKNIESVLWKKMF